MCIWLLQSCLVHKNGTSYKVTIFYKLISTFLLEIVNAPWYNWPEVKINKSKQLFPHNIFVCCGCLTFPHIKKLSDASAADDFCKQLQKKKMLMMSNFTFDHNVFNSIEWLNFHLYRCYMFLSRCFQSRLLLISCMRQRVNPFPHKDAFWRLCSR